MTERILVLVATALGFAAVACGNGPLPTPGVPARPAAEGTSASAAVEATPAPLVIFLGDSLTAGYGLAEEQAFPALIEDDLIARGVSVRVVNAGVSGDTTAGGVSRLDWFLRQGPDVVVVELGANDGLRGLPLAMTERNLREIVTRCLDAGARVLLVGMKLPPNYGPEYTSGFEAIFERLAGELDVGWMPFLLDGVAADPALNLPDGIHPNAEGQRRVADSLLPYLEPLLPD